MTTLDLEVSLCKPLPQRVRMLALRLTPEHGRRLHRFLVASLPHVCQFVVTPNVDHAVMVQKHAGLRSVYDEAHLIQQSVAHHLGVETAEKGAAAASRRIGVGTPVV